MKIELKLLTSESLTVQGYPLAINISHQGKRKRKNIAFCLEKHFIEDEGMVSSKHPDYDVLAPIIMNLKIKARKIIMNQCKSVDVAFEELFSIDFSEIGFIDYAKKLISEMQQMAEVMKKFDEKGANKILGNVKVYQNVVSQFENFAKSTSLQNLDYETISRFKTYNLSIGNSKSTINLYLRTIRAIYNKGILIYSLPDKKPFKAVFDGLRVKSYDSRKKYLDREGIAKLEALNLNSAKQKYVDLFLLQFYFGGCDLIDLYYLKERQVRKGRIVFERTKTSTGNRIDLKVHPNAQKIIDKYRSGNEWLFPWNKDKKLYESFRRAYQKALIDVQKKESIEVLPDGGNVAIKVARHSFANRAKTLMIESDVIRELMGHERDDVDNYYKDKYPEKVRDMALFEILSPFECLK